MFEGRKLIIATMHGKEMVIAPILEQGLGVQCFIDEYLDTDALGTFTGEVERALDPISTARKKCLLAMERTGCDLGIASEGSFGPHPTAFFVSADDEFLIFIDALHGLEIIARELSMHTNFNGKLVQDERELLQFAEAAGFPSHGLILRKSSDDTTGIRKGIREKDALLQAYADLLTSSKTAYVETDMRAMHNPTRMAVIETAAQKLVQKIKSTCPACQTPGFGVTNLKPGLPCGLCGWPTNSTLSLIYVCGHCKFTQEEMYPHQKVCEDPMYCDRCNP